MPELQSNPLASLTGYELLHLSEHLEAGGRFEELHRLLALETSDHRNAWFEAKDAIGDTAGYLDDIRRAWRLAEKADGDAIGLQCRYALLTTSVNSLAGNIPPALLLALVEKGVWQPAQALAYARRIPDHEQHAKALMKLSPFVLETERFFVLQEALVAARDIRDEQLRCNTLAKLAQYLLEPFRDEALRAALAAAREIRDQVHQAKTLAGLAPHLPESLLRKALAVAQEMTYNFGAGALAGLAPRLAELGYLEEALAVARGIKDDIYRTQALAGLASHLPRLLRDEALREALVIARDIRDGYTRAKALAGLAPRLAELGYPEEALVIAREIKDDDARAGALAGLAPHLPEPLLCKALAMVREIKRDFAGSRINSSRAEALAELAPHLPVFLRDEAVREALGMTWAGQTHLNRELGEARKDFEQIIILPACEQTLATDAAFRSFLLL